MILEERHLPFEEIGDLFEIVAEELSSNINTQIIISEDILKELRTNNCNYNVYFHNYLDDHFVSEWFTLHDKNASSPLLSKLGIRPFGNNFSQVSRFKYRGYKFSNKPYNSEEFYFFEHEFQRILVIKVS